MPECCSPFGVARRDCVVRGREPWVTAQGRVPFGVGMWRNPFESTMAQSHLGFREREPLVMARGRGSFVTTYGCAPFGVARGRDPRVVVST